MIENDKQLQITKKRVDEFKQALESYKDRDLTQKDALLRDALASELEVLTGQIKEYEEKPG